VLHSEPFHRRPSLPGVVLLAGLWLAAVAPAGATMIFADGFEECGIDRWSAGPFPTVSERFIGVTPAELAEALGACGPSLVAAEFRLADGSVPSGGQLADMANSQSAVFVQFGTAGPPPILPTAGPSLAALSSGTARDADTPGYIAPEPGTDFASSSPPPAVVLAAHGGSLPTYPGCPAPAATAHDPVALRLTLHVPATATRLALDWLFLSANFAEWLCTVADDYFMIVVQGSSPALPADRNLALDSSGNPMSSMHDDYYYCQATPPFTCLGGDGRLLGTGYEMGIGGATDWHTAFVPVVPGETLVVDLMVFEGLDGTIDTAVLLDGLRWLGD